MESKLKVFFLAAIALGIWVQVFQNASQSSMTRYVSVVNDVNVRFKKEDEEECLQNNQNLKKKTNKFTSLK